MGTTRETGGIRGATELRERIEEWRRTRARRCQMPADLWDGAVSLARVHGPYQVSRALGVHYGALKSRLEGVKSTPSKKRSDSAGFIEVPSVWLGGGNGPASASSGTPESSATLELTARNGARMTIRVRGVEGLDLVEVAAGLWRRCR